MNRFLKEVEVVGLGKRGGIVAVSPRKAKVNVKVRGKNIELVPEPGEYALIPKRHKATIHFIALTFMGEIVFVYDALWRPLSMNKNGTDTFTAVLRET